MGNLEEIAMPQLAKLFSLGKIGKMTLPNRIIMAPMGNAVASDEGYVTPTDNRLF